MSNTIQSKICPICHREISTQNFEIHCMRCQKYQICPICNESVQTIEEHILDHPLCAICNERVIDIDEHNKTNHVLCCLCNEYVEELEKHKLEKHPPLACENCHRLIDPYLLDKHNLEECPRRIVGQCPYCEIDLLAETKDGIAFLLFPYSDYSYRPYP